MKISMSAILCCLVRLTAAAAIASLVTEPLHASSTPRNVSALRAQMRAALKKQLQEQLATTSQDAIDKAAEVAVHQSVTVAPVQSGEVKTDAGDVVSPELVALAKELLPTVAPTGDERENFEANAYVGIGVDTFAAEEFKTALAGEPHAYVNPEDASQISERAIAGVNFQYRLRGDRENPRKSQLWVEGGTTHGVRSADVPCEEHPDYPTCKQDSLPSPTDDPAEFIYLVRSATSLEGHVGVRWELPHVAFNAEGEHPARLYLVARAGFLTVEDNGGDVSDCHVLALGVTSTGGRFLNSKLEVGFGRTDLFRLHREDRWKVDGLLNVQLAQAGGKNTQLANPARLSFFMRMLVDADAGRGSDSVQSFLGFNFDFGHFNWGKGSVARKPDSNGTEEPQQ